MQPSAIIIPTHVRLAAKIFVLIVMMHMIAPTNPRRQTMSKNEKVFVGIDPGLDGAVCIRKNGDIEFYDTPTFTVEQKKGGKIKKKREFGTVAMAEFLQFTNSSNVIVALEQISAMPGQGVTSMFQLGKGYGIWLGILAAYNLSYELVRPQAWKKELMAGMGKEKDASRVVACRLFPRIAKALSRKKDHGRADALLLSEFIRRRHARS
jgi:crossover junction endodeoxyribonuclease RuvC